MKNSKSGKSVLTGVFIIAGLVILFILVFIIGGKNKTFSKTVSAKAVFTEVNGLIKGANVWFRGVKVGIVKEIFFTDAGVEVAFKIDEAAAHRIPADTKVKLGSDGLIGNKIMVLYGGTAGGPVMVNGATLAVQQAEGTEEIMATLQDNNKNLLQITSDFKTVSRSLAQGNGTIGKLLTDETLLNSLQATLLTLNKASGNTQLLTANLAEFTRRLNRKGSLTNDLLTDTTIFTSLLATVAQLKQVSVTTNKAVNDLSATTAKLNSTDGPVGVLLNDAQTAANIKATVANLQTGTHKLDESMEALQHNFLLRGFFRKKEKAVEKQRKDSLATVVILN